jgi:transcriptional regulator with PAS, ATPase and Fis domain
LQHKAKVLETTVDDLITATLVEHKGNVASAAERLGISRQALYQRINKRQRATPRETVTP